MQIRTYGSGTLVRGAEDYSGGAHLHYAEVLYITEGKVFFHWRGHSCIAEAPAVFILTPSTPHEIESISAESKYRFWELLLNDESPFQDEHMDRWNRLQQRNDFYSKTLLADLILKALDTAYHLLTAEGAQSKANLEQVCLLEIEKSLQLISHLLNDITKPSFSAAEQKKLNEQDAIDMVIEYMDWRYKEDITLETLAQLVHLNPSYLIRVFKRQKGITPFEYLRHLRLNAAVSYLSGSEMPIKKIVEQTRFHSVHYFGRVFKKAYGISPAQWRKQLKRR
ncbi:helix-turn-helix transcriptional regulator [Paenibacillus sp. SAF-054]|uniref:helix-turn-helix transcriptional regulator n=1 Tax=unclassified Paenibacillus TaxID=185978 RepID=UPI003F7FFBA7